MYNYTNSIAALSAFSNHKEKALTLINELYQNRELYDLLHFGIEGKHYSLTGDNKYKATPNHEDAGWISTGVTNDAYEYETELTFPGAQELVDKFEEMRVYSPSVNCPVDDSGIREIKLALSEVYNQYTAPLYYGIVSGTVEEAIAAELDELKKAGIDQYMEALQSQFDEYVASIGE